MKCYYHPDRDAVAQCVECHKGLCNECAHKWEPPHCDGCGVSLKDVAKHRLTIIKVFGIAGIVAGIFGAVMAGGIGNVSTALVYLIFIPLFAYETAAIPAGWWKLNMITSKFFLILPIVGWLIYFGIKFTLASIVGLFVLPFEYKRLKNIVKNQ